jgi:hypothetical protein
MTPAIGFILAGLFAAAPMANKVTRTQVNDVLYECPQTYKLATVRGGEIICLRYRRDLAH